MVASRSARPAWIFLAAVAACSDTKDRTGRSVQADTPCSFHMVTAADFNADGLQDVLWNDTACNRMTVSLFRGTGLLEQGPTIPGPRGTGWLTVTAADFNFDGMADASWYSPDGRRTAVWLMRATHVIERSHELPQPPGEGWALAYGGDMNGDGMADLLWYSEAQHRIAVWLMQDLHVVDAGPALPGPPGDGWMVSNIADFNADGMQDVLWFNTRTHRVAVWLMQGTRVLERGPEIPSPPGDGWTVPSSADFNADGMSDVIWSDATTGRMAISLLRGTCLMEAGPVISGPAGDGWSVGTAGDTNGDGMADAMWQNADGHRMAVWLMNGTHVVEPGPVLLGPP
jgi:hypothetical protein